MRYYSIKQAVCPKKVLCWWQRYIIEPNHRTAPVFMRCPQMEDSFRCSFWVLDPFGQQSTRRLHFNKCESGSPVYSFCFLLDNYHDRSLLPAFVPEFFCRCLCGLLCASLDATPSHSNCLALENANSFTTDSSQWSSTYISTMTKRTIPYSPVKSLRAF